MLARGCGRRDGRRLLVAIAVAMSAVFSAHAEADPPPLVLAATIPLERVAGRIDHLAIDRARQRLIVAELGNDSVDVIELAASRVVHRINGLKAPQGVAASAERIIVASAGDGSVSLFRADD